MLRVRKAGKDRSILVAVIGALAAVVVALIYVFGGKLLRDAAAPTAAPSSSSPTVGIQSSPNSEPRAVTPPQEKAGGLPDTTPSLSSSSSLAHLNDEQLRRIIGDAVQSGDLDRARAALAYIKTHDAKQEECDVIRVRLQSVKRFDDARTLALNCWSGDKDKLNATLQDIALEQVKSEKGTRE